MRYRRSIDWAACAPQPSNLMSCFALIDQSWPFNDKIDKKQKNGLKIYTLSYQKVWIIQSPFLNMVLFYHIFVIRARQGTLEPGKDIFSSTEHLSPEGHCNQFTLCRSVTMTNAMSQNFKQSTLAWLVRTIFWMSLSRQWNILAFETSYFSTQFWAFVHSFRPFLYTHISYVNFIKFEI